MICLDGYTLLPWPPMNKSRENLVAGRRIIKTQKYREWKEMVAAWLAGTGLPLLPAPLLLEAVLLRPDLRRVDLDNCLSGLMDAANGVLYQDDSDIWAIRVSKEIDRSSKEPRLYFRVSQIPERLSYTSLS